MKEKIKVYEKQSLAKQIRDAYEAAKTPLTFEPEHLVHIGENIYGYTNLEKASEYLHAKGICLAAVVSAKTMFGETLQIVMCNNIAFELPEYVQEFLIQHEIGHAVNGDLNMTPLESCKLMIKRTLGFLPEMELKADAYAAKVNGIESTKNAIKFLILDTNLPFISKLELIRRYKKVHYCLE